MKIAVTSTGPGLDSEIDPRFGRCPFFVLVDTETGESRAVENPNAALGGGAGIQAAQLIAEQGAKFVLTGNCGPNAYQVLSGEGIEIVVGCSGKVADAVEKLKSGELKPAGEANVADKFGVGSSSGSFAPGGGRGMGRGMGMGRGLAAVKISSSAPSSGNEDLDSLKEQARRLEEQMRSLQERIEGMSREE